MIAFLFILLSCKSSKDYLKLVYIKGAPDGPNYEPCVCRQSMWNKEYGPLKTMVTYNEKKINTFITAVENKDAPHVRASADFTNAFIYKKGSKIDTVYANQSLDLFAKRKPPLVGNMRWTIWDALAPANSALEFIPKNFITKYRKEMPYNVVE